MQNSKYTKIETKHSVSDAADSAGTGAMTSVSTAKVKAQQKPILLIVNPASKSGLGRANGQIAYDCLKAALGERFVSMEYTQSANHATQIAKEAYARAQDGCPQDLYVLGGDGVIHEVANGLLDKYAEGVASVSQAIMPTLGIIPVGSGNDYARSLGMSSDVRTACSQLLAGHVKRLDAGVVNGVYFVETLSFGVDAAIALQTMELRAKAGKSSKTLYVQAGIDQILHHRDIRSYSVSFDGAAPIRSESLTFAVQVGQYYGGGFKIAPEARLDDGLFDVCIAHPPISLPGALRLFALAKSGKHITSPKFEIKRAKTLDITFDGQPPTQADGEAVVGQRFKIQIIPHALNVIIPTPA